MKASELVNFVQNTINSDGDFEVNFVFGDEHCIEVFERCLWMIPPEGSKDVDDTKRFLVPDPEYVTDEVIYLKPTNLH